MKIPKESYRLLLKVLALTIASVYGAIKYLGHKPVATYSIVAISVAVFLIVFIKQLKKD